jgi:hypothetical protein
MKTKTAFLLVLLLCLCRPLFPFEGFKSKEEAQAEMDRMYGGEMGEEQAQQNKPDEFTSICLFMNYVLSRPDEKIIIVYGSDNEKDAVEMLKTFINRKRGHDVAAAERADPTILVKDDSKVDLAVLDRSKAFILGSPVDNFFIQRMTDKKKISISGNKAQFRLFESPNCLAIACEKDGMFVELVRIFLRSYQDFDENCYSYFFMN